MENKIKQFEFETFSISKHGQSLSLLKQHYSDVLSRYFLEVFNKKGVIFTIEEQSKTFLNHNDCLYCRVMVNSEDIAHFRVYSQNNCCGAMSVSGTHVYDNYANKKLGTLLQYIKEDIFKKNGVSLATCTDIYINKYNPSTDGDFNTIQPYLKNTKILLSNGWKVSKLFHNVKSQNVVALYVKDINSKDHDSKKVVLNINVEPKLTKIENVMIGADPELFLKVKGKKSYVPSYDYISGDKHNVTPITEDGHGISSDNVMVE
jgi:hypothetical protein